MPRTKEENSRIRDSQRARILEAAWKVFARKGRSMTMADVAAEAGVSYGLSYRYFPTKETILRALVEDKLKASSSAFKRFDEISGTPGERLGYLIASLIENRRTNSDLHQMFYHVLADTTTKPAVRKLAAEHGSALQDTLRRLIVEARKNGEIVDADPDQLVTALLAVLEGLTRLAVIAPERFKNHFPDPDIFLSMFSPGETEK